MHCAGTATAAVVVAVVAVVAPVAAVAPRLPRLRWPYIPPGLCPRTCEIDAGIASLGVLKASCVLGPSRCRELGGLANQGASHLAEASRVRAASCRVGTSLSLPVLGKCSPPSSSQTAARPTSAVAASPSKSPPGSVTCSSAGSTTVRDLGVGLGQWVVGGGCVAFAVR